MLFKLSLAGFKERRQDYLVLFSGLAFVVAIFYMFESIATNQALIHSTSAAAVLPVIFRIGSVLLSLITIIYITYANSFLLSLRQREYGMYMMLGARKSKIAQIMAGETLWLGLIAWIFGIGLGLGLTAGVSQLLMKVLAIHQTKFMVWNGKALLVTLVLFFILFVLAAIFNAGILSKKRIINLLRADQKAQTVRLSGLKRIVLLVVALILLALGYWGIYRVGGGDKSVIFDLILALITIPVGTYLVYLAAVPQLIRWFRLRPGTISHGLHTFTFGQIEFRMGQYAKMLSVVTILLALALGSITFGFGFAQQVQKVNDKYNYYDTILNQPNRQEMKMLDQVKGSKQLVDYRYKVQDNQVYFLKDDLKQHKPVDKTLEKGHKLSNQDLNRPILSADWQQALYSIYPLYQLKITPEIKVADQKQFNQLAGGTQRLMLVKTDRFHAYHHLWGELDRIEMQRHHVGRQEYLSRYATQQQLQSAANGFEFMGFFLGVAFLAMMASTLMFKVLSGAQADRKRYTMLMKVGATRGDMQRAIWREIGWLFVIPSMVGAVHVIFGLQMFRPFLNNPYGDLWIPFGIFAILYVMYYFITVGLYQKIVLPKRA